MRLILVPEEHSNEEGKKEGNGEPCHILGRPSFHVCVAREAGGMKKRRKRRLGGIVTYLRSNVKDGETKGQGETLAKTIIPLNPNAVPEFTLTDHMI